jgi:hypothetical protein
MKASVTAGITILLTLLLVVFFGCHGNSIPSQGVSESKPSVALTPQANIESERYAVLSALIKEMYIDDRTKLLVILHQDSGPTSSQTPEPHDERVEEMRGHMEDYAFKELPGLTPETVDSFHSEAKEYHPLARQLDVPTKYVLVRAKDLEPLFPKRKPDRAWSRFYARYPSSSGIISFSNPGFNGDLTQALVSTARSCGGLCGAGYFVLLAKDQGVWKVHAKVMTWVS